MAFMLKMSLEFIVVICFFVFFFQFAEKGGMEELKTKALEPFEELDPAVSCQIIDKVVF